MDKNNELIDIKSDLILIFEDNKVTIEDIPTMIKLMLKIKSFFNKCFF